MPSTFSEQLFFEGEGIVSWLQLNKQLSHDLSDSAKKNLIQDVFSSEWVNVESRAN